MITDYAINIAMKNVIEKTLDIKEIDFNEELRVSLEAANFTLTNDYLYFTILNTFCQFNLKTKQIKTLNFQENDIKYSINDYILITLKNDFYIFQKDFQIIKAFSSTFEIISNPIKINNFIYYLCAGNVILELNLETFEKKTYYSSYAGEFYLKDSSLHIYQDKIYFWNVGIFEFDINTKEFSCFEINKVKSFIGYENKLYLYSDNALVIYDLDLKTKININLPKFYKFSQDKDIIFILSSESLFEIKNNQLIRVQMPMKISKIINSNGVCFFTTFLNTIYFYKNEKFFKIETSSENLICALTQNEENYIITKDKDLKIIKLKIK